jgi:wobble nucleotide-excising tRNase
LFLVGSLIKDIFEEIRTDVGHIKQIFVLTHNVYFHKEVTYNRRRPNNGVLSEETFWIVKKPGLESRLAAQATNPIKTSYELLWAEVRKPERSNLAIQNTLRRILENYFKILGGIELDRLCDKFDGREKIICKSLVSWVHDGSHYAQDDLYVSIDDSMVEKYLNVFREIFVKERQIEHYKMMMGDAFIEEPTAIMTSVTSPLPSPPQ